VICLAPFAVVTVPSVPRPLSAGLATGWLICPELSGQRICG